MKITNPLLLLGVLIVAVAIAAIASQRRDKPVLKTVQVSVTDEATTSVSVKADGGSGAVAAALNDLKARDRRWKDATDLASRTSRISLAGIVKDMQDQLRDNEDAILPGCLGTAKPYWLEAQRETISGYLEFMGQNDFLSADHFRNAERAERNYRMVLDACRPGVGALGAAG